MFTFSLLLIATVILILVYLIKLAKRRPENFPPGPPRLPLWGSYWFLLKENYTFPHRALDNLAKRYKTNILGLYLGDFPTIVLTNYEMCKEVLTRDEFIGRVDTVVVRGRGAGERLGIFFVDGLYWQEQRRFSLRHLRDYGFGRRFADMEDIAAVETKQMLEFLTSTPKSCDYDICTKKGIVKFPDLFFGPSVNVLMSMLASKRFEHHELRPISRATMQFIRGSDMTGSAISMTPWLKHIAPGIFGYNAVVDGTKILLDFFKGLVEEHKKTYSEDYCRNFIDEYLGEYFRLQEKNEKHSFTDNQLLFVLIDYTFPASVGIAHALNYLTVYLLNQPEIQTKIQEEIDDVAGRGRLPTLDDRKHLHYTEATIREILRKDPVAVLGITHRSTTDTTLGGYNIPENTIVITNLWSAHNDPKLWGDPENFRPERWLDEDGKILKKDFSLPFGAGKRLCAGETFARQMLYLLLTGLLQNFTLKVPAGEKPPSPDDHIWGFIVVHSDIYVEVVPR